jgi:hypothetical protein
MGSTQLQFSRSISSGYAINTSLIFNYKIGNNDDRIQSLEDRTYRFLFHSFETIPFRIL